MRVPLPIEVITERAVAIVGAVAQLEGALQVIATGSFGLEPPRVDGYSDLDLILVVDPGRLEKLCHSLDWLETVHPIAWRFRYYPDCWRLMFADGLFCELAIQTPQALSGLDYAGGRTLWAAQDLEPQIIQNKEISQNNLRDPAWVTQEIICNLYISATKYRRGEHLSAMTYVHQDCRKLLLELITATHPAAPGVSTDPYGLERRFEHRYPGWQEEFTTCFQGYKEISASIQGIINLVTRRFHVFLQKDSRFLIQAIQDLVAT
jgi:hypothetical protein